MLRVTVSDPKLNEEKVIRSCKSHADMTFFYPDEAGFAIDGTSGELRGDFDLLKRVLSERAGVIRLKMVTDAGEVCLVFPSYLYDFIEDTRARAIHHKIEGSGYVYRECVWRRSIRLREYDGLFTHATDEGGTAPIDIALGRLLAPVDLAVGHRERYERYLEARAFAVLAYIFNFDLMEIPRPATSPSARSDSNSTSRPASSTTSQEPLRSRTFSREPFPWHPMKALLLMTERMLIDRDTVDAILPGCDTPALSEAAAVLLAYEKEHWGKQRAQAMTLDLL